MVDLSTGGGESQVPSCPPKYVILVLNADKSDSDFVLNLGLLLHADSMSAITHADLISLPHQPPKTR